MKMRNEAPNVYLILLWHHFCYYKRHYIVFIMTLLMPFLIIATIYALSYVILINSPSTQYRSCLQQTTPLISSNIFHYSNLLDCNRVYENNAHLGSHLDDQKVSDTCDDKRYSCRYPSQTCVMEDKYIEESLSDHRPFCPVLSTPDHNSCQCSDWDVYCTPLQGQVVYYPNTTKVVQEIMKNVQTQIDSVGEALKILSSTRDWDPEHSPVADLMKMVKYANCFEKAGNRILGFTTRQEMLEYVKWMNDSNSGYSYGMNIPPRTLWAALNFDGNTDDSTWMKYSILRHNEMYNDMTIELEQKSIMIQDLVESAIVKHKLNLDQLPVSPLWKVLPSKCWIRLPDEFIYTLLTFLLPMGCVISLLFAPINFMEQVLTEKSLKLREYLSIMGVSDTRLKASWIIFYMIFLLPASIIMAILIRFTYGGSMARTDPSILIVLFLVYNLSQLCLAYFLSSFMKEAKRVAFIYSFVSMLPTICAVLAFQLSGSKLTGAFLVVSRIASLHCSVPFALSLCHVISWEKAWIGSEWSYFFYSPELENGYSGFGEGIIWMLADCILYLILAWYLRNVMPGDYGIKRKPYFFLSPSYWKYKRCSRKSGSFVKEIEMNHLVDGSDAQLRNRAEELKPDVEPREQDPNKNATLIIDRLTKFYDNQKLGIDRLSLTVYQNEITALLGQNGAGKSTTLNTLVGLLTPTAGCFSVSGLDNANQMDEIKKLIAFVPQYDILYPSMTVEEHIQFFGWLKGMDKKQIHATVYPMLEKFGVSHLKKTITTKLSGGEKRKLSILTAYLGNPELVILDEPTTGIDPYSRRSIWDVLLHHRLTTATIISTHFMDEADLLSDRVAIVSEGTLRCVGSPMYLKNKYAQGFRVITACKNYEQSIENTKQFFYQTDSDIQLTQTSGRDLTFTIPKEYARSDRMIDLLKSIEQHRDQIGIQSFGVSEPTLEEAFFQAAQVDPHHTQPTSDGIDENQALGGRRNSTSLVYQNRLGIRLWLHQFVALLNKRFILTIRTPSTIALQIALPLTFIIIFLLTSTSLVSQSGKLTPIHIYQSYRKNVLFFQEKTSSQSKQALDLFETVVQQGLGPRCPQGFGKFQCDSPNSNNADLHSRRVDLGTNRQACTDCKTYCPEGNARTPRSWTTPSRDLVYALPTAMDATDWVLAANQSDHWVVGGFQFYARNYSFDTKSPLGQFLTRTTPSSYVVVWTRPELKMAMLNAYYNLLLQTYSNDKAYTIRTYFEDIRFHSWKEERGRSISDDISRYVGIFVGSFLLVLAITFATFSTSVVIQQEKCENLKELQYTSGAKPSAYWLANFIWDFCQFLLTLIIILILLLIFDNMLRSDLNAYVNILIPFGFSTVGFIYMISFLFKSSTGVNRLIIGLTFANLLFGMSVTMFEFTNTLDKIKCQKYKDCAGENFAWSPYVGFVLRFIPFYYLTDGCFTIGMVIVTSVMLGDPRTSLGLNVYDMELLGKRIIQGYFVAVFWFSMVVLLEYHRAGLLRSKCFKCRKSQNHQSMTTYNPDPDVQEEERRILQNSTLDEPVIVKRVTKKYPRAIVPAVDSVTFGIPRSQCFGLLGINGAGKTTLFRIMTGLYAPSRGETLIEGHNVVYEKYMLARNISYCPQDNTLFDELTVWEHLRMFASLRGIPHAHAATVVDSLVQEVGLTDHAHKLAKHLSGGNKRKLNFALALLDYKPVIFLDEPTSGMDPGARRRTWTCIENAIARGSSVVLTSHSMDECEALCHRLVIMARGKLCCIGSIQYLKDKFGNRYTVKIKLTNTANENRSNMINDLKMHIQTRLPESRLTEDHSAMIQYEVAAGNQMPLSTIFSILCECRNLFASLVEDFTLSQVTLERVFVGMAERQQNEVNQGVQNVIIHRNGYENKAMDHVSHA